MHIHEVLFTAGVIGALSYAIQNPPETDQCAAYKKLLPFAPTFQRSPVHTLTERRIALLKETDCRNGAKFQECTRAVLKLSEETFSTLLDEKKSEDPSSLVTLSHLSSHFQTVASLVDADIRSVHTNVVYMKQNPPLPEESVKELFFLGSVVKFKFNV